MEMICVGCGGSANKGSMKHPYCKKCFTKQFGTGKSADKKYNEFMQKTHDSW